MPAAAAVSDPAAWVAGVDEAGRGCLAGPVVAAAVVLAHHAQTSYPDSKTIKHVRRLALVERLYAGEALAVGIGWASVAEIDSLNILQASLLAMRRALVDLAERAGRSPDSAVIDGLHTPGALAHERALVDGDALDARIGAASLVAKVFRDQWLTQLDADYPQYGFGAHFGYGTAAHLAALDRHGVSPWHRRTFAPVRNRLAQPDLFGL